MSDLLESYDLSVDELVEFYRRLNKPITYPDGMVTSLGIIYWGRDEHFAALADSILCLKAEGIYKFSTLLESIKTPGRMKQFSKKTGISPAILRILKHDLELWFPRPVPLAMLEPIQHHSAYFDQLAAVGISNQLQMVSSAQTPQSRRALSKRTGVPMKAVVEIAKCCDLYRMGSNLRHIRAQIYFDMGLDTWQKWASMTSEEIIRMFINYIQQHDLDAVRLVPWPKEVRNGIEWARQHLKVFAVEW